MRGAWNCSKHWAQTLEVPRVAAGDVHMHRRSRRALQDVLTAIRLGTPLQAAGYALFPNGERCLRPLQRLRELYPAPLLAQTLQIAERCTFNLDELRYEYPEEIVPAGATPTSHLRALTMRGCAQRWPAGAPAAVRDNIEHELRLIAELKFEPFFLTVHDVVRIRAFAENTLPGPRFRGQFRRLLLPGDHRGGSLAHGHAVRALHFQGAQ